MTTSTGVVDKCSYCSAPVGDFHHDGDLALRRLLLHLEDVLNGMTSSPLLAQPSCLRSQAGVHCNISLALKASDPSCLSSQPRNPLRSERFGWSLNIKKYATNIESAQSCSPLKQNAEPPIPDGHPLNLNANRLNSKGTPLNRNENALNPGVNTLSPFRNQINPVVKPLNFDINTIISKMNPRGNPLNDHVIVEDSGCFMSDDFPDETRSSADDFVSLKINKNELLESCFYHGNLSQADAVLLLKDSATGTFLVRDSSHPRYVYSLSMKTKIGATSVRIFYSNGLFGFDGDEELLETPRPQFGSLLSLIDYISRLQKHHGKKLTMKGKTDRTPVNVTFRQPKWKTVPSLFHLSRLQVNRCLRDEARQIKTRGEEDLALEINGQKQDNHRSSLGDENYELAVFRLECLSVSVKARLLEYKYTV